MTLHATPTSASVAARLPGVRIDWSFRQPTPAFVSGVPLFVGFVSRPATVDGDDPPALRFERWEHFARSLGAATVGYLDYAVKGFFENGGARCWVVALGIPADADAALLQETLEHGFRAGGPIDDLSDPDLVCVPDATWGVLGRDRAAVLAVQSAVLAHCNRMNDRLAILDCLPADGGTMATSGFDRASARIALRHDGASTRPASGDAHDLGQVTNGAVYWPWIHVRPMARHPGQSPAVPPCGHIAGVYARVDAAQGRHKAPANELLVGVHDVDDAVSADALADLNDAGTNSLQVMPGRGVRVCGARSLSTRVAWRYVNVRRVVLGLARWAETSLGDFVMETNDAALWQRIRQRVDTRCLALYGEGALRGDSPAAAYYVKCDAETNPPAIREVGQVVCEVGLAITTPAEFIVIRLIQSAEGTEISE